MSFPVLIITFTYPGCFIYFSFRMKTIGLFLFAAILISCNPVQTSYNKHIDFSQYKSFCWMNGCISPFTGPLYMDDSVIQEKVKTSIILELENKGFTYNSTNPDLIIDFHITISDEEVITYHMFEDEPDYYRTTFLQPEKITLTKGSILIHIVDRAKSEVIWQSEAAGYLDTPTDITEKQIRKGIIKLLKEFPPQKNSK